MDSGIAVCRYGHAALDAHILSGYGSILLLVCAGATMDRNYQRILKTDAASAIDSGIRAVRNSRLRVGEVTASLVASERPLKIILRGCRADELSGIYGKLPARTRVRSVPP